MLEKRSHRGIHTEIKLNIINLYAILYTLCNIVMYNNILQSIVHISPLSLLKLKKMYF